MRNYQISAVDQKGNSLSDIISAESDQELFQIVKSRKLYLVEFNQATSVSRTSSKLKMKSLVIYCRQLGTMIASGIPIMQSLDILQGKADSSKTRRVFRSVYEEVQKGNSLSKAMELQEGAFPQLLLKMVMAGEIGGSLDNSLNRMAVHFEKEQKLSNKVRSASVYPIILSIVSVAVVLMLVTFVLPTITSLFDPKDMPWTTKIILGFSNFITGNWIMIIVVLVALVFLFFLGLSIKPIRIQFDRMKLNIPIVGKLNQTIYSARCARALSSLYSSGIQTIQMLEITSQVLGNAYLEDQFFDVISEVSKGELISKAIGDTASFDPMLSSMIYIGEEAGSLGKILVSTADYFDDEADSAIQRLLSMFEPLLLIVLGVVIGFIVVSIIQPIYAMYGSIGN